MGGRKCAGEELIEEGRCDFKSRNNHGSEGQKKINKKQRL